MSQKKLFVRRKCRLNGVRKKKRWSQLLELFNGHSRKISDAWWGILGFRKGSQGVSHVSQQKPSRQHSQQAGAIQDRNIFTHWSRQLQFVRDSGSSVSFYANATRDYTVFWLYASLSLGVHSYSTTDLLQFVCRGSHFARMQRLNELFA